jgi:hypothetical protein
LWIRGLPPTPASRAVKSRDRKCFTSYKNFLLVACYQK